MEWAMEWAKTLLPFFYSVAPVDGVVIPARQRPAVTTSAVPLRL
jgi:hypothetical protein